MAMFKEAGSLDVKEKKQSRSPETQSLIASAQTSAKEIKQDTDQARQKERAEAWFFRVADTVTDLDAKVEVFESVWKGGEPFADGLVDRGQHTGSGEKWSLGDFKERIEAWKKTNGDVPGFDYKKSLSLPRRMEPVPIVFYSPDEVDSVQNSNEPLLTYLEEKCGGDLEKYHRAVNVLNLIRRTRLGSKSENDVRQNKIRVENAALHPEPILQSLPGMGSSEGWTWTNPIDISDYLINSLEPGGKQAQASTDRTQGSVRAEAVEAMKKLLDDVVDVAGMPQERAAKAADRLVVKAWQNTYNTYTDGGKIRDPRNANHWLNMNKIHRLPGAGIEERYGTKQRHLSEPASKVIVDMREPWRMTYADPQKRESALPPVREPEAEPVPLESEPEHPLYADKEKDFAIPSGIEISARFEGNVQPIINQLNDELLPLLPSDVDPSKFLALATEIATTYALDVVKGPEKQFRDLPFMKLLNAHELGSKQGKFIRLRLMKIIKGVYDRLPDVPSSDSPLETARRAFASPDLKHPGEIEDMKIKDRAKADVEYKRWIEPVQADRERLRKEIGMEKYDDFVATIAKYDDVQNRFVNKQKEYATLGRTDVWSDPVWNEQIQSEQWLKAWPPEFVKQARSIEQQFRSLESSREQQLAMIGGPTYSTNQFYLHKAAMSVMRLQADLRMDAKHFFQDMPKNIRLPYRAKQKLRKEALDRLASA